MDHKYILQNEISEKYLLDRLDADERAAYEAYLAANPEARQALEADKMLIAGIREVGKSDMKAEIRRQAAALRASQPPVDNFGWMKIAAAVAVFAISLGGFFYFQSFDKGLQEAPLTSESRPAPQADNESLMAADEVSDDNAGTANTGSEDEFRSSRPANEPGVGLPGELRESVASGAGTAVTAEEDARQDIPAAEGRTSGSGGVAEIVGSNQPAPVDSDLLRDNSALDGLAANAPRARTTIESPLKPSAETSQPQKMEQPDLKNALTMKKSAGRSAFSDMTDSSMLRSYRYSNDERVMAEQLYRRSKESGRIQRMGKISQNKIQLPEASFEEASASFYHYVGEQHALTIYFEMPDTTALSTADSTAIEALAEKLKGSNKSDIAGARAQKRRTERNASPVATLPAEFKVIILEKAPRHLTMFWNINDSNLVVRPSDLAMVMMNDKELRIYLQDKLTYRIDLQSDSTRAVRVK